MTYYGITIGPVVETLMMSSKPLGLWYSSYLFSEFSRRICQKVHQLEGTELLVPYFSAEEMSEPFTAVGMFPDRIIFSSLADEATIRSLVEIVRLELEGLLFGVSGKEVSSRYLYYHLVKLNRSDLEGQELIRLVSSALDSMELNAPSVDGFLVTRVRKIVSENDVIKRSALFSDCQTSLRTDLGLLGEEDKVRSLEQICQNSFGDAANQKTSKYYAIIQADGDGVGKYIGNLTTNQDIKDFSKKMFDYASGLTEVVKAYGASLIYAGGDDLLVLVPMEQPEGRTIFGLCKEINAAFCEAFDDRVSISFGVSIFYYKYPLYEAFKNAQYQLFGQAKQVEGKKCISLYLQKHSGQSVQLLIKHDWSTVNLSDLSNNDEALHHSVAATFQAQNLFDFLLAQAEEGASDEEVNRSILFHLLHNRFAFEFALKQSMETSDNRYVNNFISNYFNHYTQKQGPAQQMIQYLQVLIASLLELPDYQSDEQKIYDFLINLLRFRKFLVEKGAE
ncbi:TPA: type III-B CRISPR-associated protein Cas10/Cmr2 [Streptococcus suis]|nr:type III-B CRISPR-associated protein Cas10/Cmr2 [Streptococcus suis]